MCHEEELYLQGALVNGSNRERIGAGQTGGVTEQSWSKCGLVDNFLRSGPTKWSEEIFIA